MGSHSVTYHPAVVRIPPLPQPKQLLDNGEIMSGKHRIWQRKEEAWLKLDG